MNGSTIIIKVIILNPIKAADVCLIHSALVSFKLYLLRVHEQITASDPHDNVQIIAAPNPIQIFSITPSYSNPKAITEIIDIIRANH